MKNFDSVENLAVFGAEPLFNSTRSVGYPRVGDRKRFYNIMDTVFDSNYLTNNGACVRELEAKLSEYLGVKNVIAVCNATVGLEIAARALELTGEVIVPSFTFIATVHILQWLGVTPVFVDVDPSTHCLNSKKVEERITKNTTGIQGVHIWGNPCDIQSLEQISKKHNIKLFFDAAHAFACSYGGKMIGSFGDCEVLSFHATKIFNTFEGGAITTNDNELASKIRKMINFGFIGYDIVQCLGLNGKMSEPAAAMGLTNLEKISSFILDCRRNYDLYNEFLSCIKGLTLYSFADGNKSNYHYIVLEVDEVRCGLSRDMLYEVLHSENCLARKYFSPGCHNSEPYKTLYPNAGVDLPITEILCKRTLVLPNHGMNEEDIKNTCKIIKLALQNASLIKQKYGY